MVFIIKTKKYFVFRYIVCHIRVAVVSFDSFRNSTLDSSGEVKKCIADVSLLVILTGMLTY